MMSVFPEEALVPKKIYNPSSNRAVETEKLAAQIMQLQDALDSARRRFRDAQNAQEKAEKEIDTFGKALQAAIEQLTKSFEEQGFERNT